MAKYDTPPTQIDTVGASVQHRAIVLDAQDTEASITAKLSAQMAPSDYDRHLALEIGSISSSVLAEVRAVEADETLSDDGRRLKLAPTFDNAAAQIDAALAQAVELEQNANELDNKTLGSAESRTDSEDDDRFVRDRVAEEAKRDLKGLAGRFMKACAKPRDQWLRSDGALIRAVLDAHDLGVPVVPDYVAAAGYNALQDQNPHRADIEASRERAASIRSLAGAARSTLQKEAERLGLADPLKAVISVDGVRRRS